MQIPLFRTIVAMKTYDCRGLRALKRPAAPTLARQNRYESEPQCVVEQHNETIYAETGHNYSWVNTNRLLGLDGIIGTKTGITEAAGPCLSCVF